MIVQKKYFKITCKTVTRKLTSDMSTMHFMCPQKQISNAGLAHLHLLLAPGETPSLFCGIYNHCIEGQIPSSAQL